MEQTKAQPLGRRSKAKVSVWPMVQQESAVRIRSFQREDEKTVWDLFSEGTVSTYCRNGENEYMRDYVKRSLTRDLADIHGAYIASGGHFWVATVQTDEGEQIVGCLGVQVSEDTHGHLRRLSIHKHFRRRRIAQTLVNHAEQWCRRHGCAVLELDTFAEMVPAIKLYEGMGYTRTKDAPFPWYDNVVLVYFEKHLGGL